MAALLTAASAAGVAEAHFQSAATAAHTVTTKVVGNPPDATASTSDGCATVNVGWSAASGADSYRVQYREGSGAWIDLHVETGNVTGVTDTTGHRATTLTYRVYGRDSRSDWEGATPAETASIVCL